MWNKTNEKLPELEKEVIVFYNNKPHYAKLIYDTNGVYWLFKDNHGYYIKVTSVDFWTFKPDDIDTTKSLSSVDILDDIKKDTEHLFMRMMSGGNSFVVDYSPNMVIISLGNMLDDYYTVILTLHQWEKLKKLVDDAAANEFFTRNIQR